MGSEIPCRPTASLSVARPARPLGGILTPYFGLEHVLAGRVHTRTATRDPLPLRFRAPGAPSRGSEAGARPVLGRLGVPRAGVSVEAALPTARACSRAPGQPRGRLSPLI